MTIKTQGGKVITKDGKVSCECCCVVYKLYPASEYGVNFFFEDLPDTLELGLADTQGGPLAAPPFIYSKVDSPYYVTGGSSNVGEALVLYKGPTEFFASEGGILESVYEAISLIEELGQNYRSIGVYECITGDCGGARVEIIEPKYVFAGFSSNGGGAPLYIQPGNIEDLNEGGGSPKAVSSDPFPHTLTVLGLGTTAQVSRRERVLFDWTGTNPPFQNRFDVYVFPYTFCFENNPDVGGLKFMDNIGFYSGANFSVYFDYVVNFTVIEGTGDTLPTIKSNSCKWKLKTPDGVFTKSGTQGSPIGSYGSYTVS